MAMLAVSHYFIFALVRTHLTVKREWVISSSTFSSHSSTWAKWIPLTVKVTLVEYRMSFLSRFLDQIGLCDVSRVFATVTYFNSNFALDDHEMSYLMKRLRQLPNLGQKGEEHRRKCL